jgi:hypothetical protein
MGTPGTTTTGSPGQTTTEPLGTTTTEPLGTTTTSPEADGPAIEEFIGRAKEDDSLDHLETSLQVEEGSSVLLSWKLLRAPDGVELTDPAQGDPQRLGPDTLTVEVQPQQESQDYSLVALAGELRSPAHTVHVATHPAGQVVSPHVQIGAGGASLSSFVAKKDDVEIASAAVGDEIELVAIVTGEPDSVLIDGEEAELCETSPGEHLAVRKVAVDANASGVFECQVMKDGAAADSSKVHLEILPAQVPVASWSTELVQLGEVAQMKLSGFAPGAQVNLEVTMVGVDVLAKPGPVTCDADGAAALDFADWFSSAISPNDPPDLADAEFPPATFTFKAIAGDVEVSSAAVTYSDSLLAQVVSHDDGTPLADTPFTVESPWGYKSGTTDAQGTVQVDHLPPGGVRILIAGDVLTASDAR